MDQKRDYSVFLSYSAEDRQWVAEFENALKDAGVEGLFDIADILPGERWQERLERALKESRTFVVVLSPRNVDNPSMFFELGVALADDKRIIPIILEDVDSTQFPLFLKQYRHVKESSPREAGRRVAEALEKSQKNG